MGRNLSAKGKVAGSYAEACTFLYGQLPNYVQEGSRALRKGLDNIRHLCAHLGHPDQQLPCVHVAGTNGKGSTVYSISAVLVSAGYHVGTYTSPHVHDFCERIRVNALPISQADVLHFVRTNYEYIVSHRPSFFELTLGMALDYFVKQKVAVAVLETGLGGRFDATNIIEKPLLSLITHVQYDHEHILGHDLQSIAQEKAGIIKAHTPILVGEKQPALRAYFADYAKEQGAYFHPQTNDYQCFTSYLGLFHRLVSVYKSGVLLYKDVFLSISASYYIENLSLIFHALEHLSRVGFSYTEDDLRSAFSDLRFFSGIKGRWQACFWPCASGFSLFLCDAAHNADALRSVLSQLCAQGYADIFAVLGFSKEKQWGRIFEVLAKYKRVQYTFVQANHPRAAPIDTFLPYAKKERLRFECASSVAKAIEDACMRAEEKREKSLVFVGGSIFVLAEIPSLR